MRAYILTVLLVCISIISFAQDGSGKVSVEDVKKSLIGSSFYSNFITPDIALFDEYNFTSFELLTANIELKKQQVIINPYKMFFDEYNDFLSETRLNISQKDNITTVGIGLGINSGVYGSTLFSATDEISKLDSRFDGLMIDNETNKPMDKDQKAKEHSNQFRNILVNASSFSFTLGSNIQFFEIIGGDKIDKDDDGKIDNEYSVKGLNFTANFIYKFNYRLTTILGYNYIEKRNSAVEGNNLQPYIGLSANISFLSVILNPGYHDTEDFKKKLFIPCIVSGVSLEYMKYNGPVGLSEDGTKEQLAVSPFIEFRINPSNIFSLALPIKQVKLDEDKNQTTIGGFLQYSIALSTSK